MSKPNRRQFVESATAVISLGFTTSTSARRIWAANKNDSINLGMIGCGDRAGSLANTFSKFEGVNIAAVCDPDNSRVARMREKFPKAQPYTDMRDMLASKEVDAVVIATTNHWHCLAAIWAMEAGKDVYVEKPLSHSQWEGAQTVAAARRFKRICQVGTQQRSDPMQTDIKQFLHGSRSLGQILSARVNRFGIRDSIGKLEQPLRVDKGIAYDLWLGPAQDLPIFRPNLHYDWHWDWNTGSGEMGNWGVHVLDDVRNIVFQDQVTLPLRVYSVGGRVVWKDAGQTPNVHFVYFDTGTVPVVIGLSNLALSPEDRKSPAPHGPSSGYLVYCEGGRLEGQRGSAVAYDSEGKQIRRFTGNSGEPTHAQNFLDALRSGSQALLNCEVEVGHASTGWCNLANIAYRVANEASSTPTDDIHAKLWLDLVKEMAQQLKAYQLRLESPQIRFSPMLEIDTDSAKFVGEHERIANRFIKRDYRHGYEVPKFAD